MLTTFLLSWKRYWCRQRFSWLENFRSNLRL